VRPLGASDLTSVARFCSNPDIGERAADRSH
jgi:hypothetical protein